MSFTSRDNVTAKLKILGEQYFKSTAPPGVVSAIQDIEDRADQCYKNLAALRAPQNLAVWAVLARIIAQIEQTIAANGYGSPAHIAVMLNLSRAASQVLNWLRQSGNKSFLPRCVFRWGEPQLVGLADQALFASVSYGAFTSNLPLWHKNLLCAELISSSSVKFVNPGSRNELRVRAFQQGLRPAGSRPIQGSSLRFGDDEPTIKQKILNLVENGSSADGPLSFSYGKPRRLWEMIYVVQIEAMNTLFRRSEALDLGSYQIGEFKRFYAGFLAICSVHENACDLRGQRQRKYPLDSAVLVKRQSQWNEILHEITGLERSKIERIMRDLTFGATAVQDVYVHPFIPLSEDGEELGVVPHFALNSRADENVIRVCSHLRPAIHDTVSRAKEDEMRAELCALSRAGLSLRGPRLLPSRLPDIDLIIEDVSTSCVIIAELKWLRKTVRPTEHPDREREFLEGVSQLDKIRGFLQQNSGFLHDKGDISQDLKSVKNLHYLLIARDYFVWVDPAQGYPVIDYETFSAAMKKTVPLAQQVRDLLKFEWLPREGIDFRSSYSHQALAGVSVESQIIHANY